MKKTVILILLIGLFISCKSSQNNSSSVSAAMKELVNIMQGSYSSEKQSIADTTYFNISLRMIPIWKNKGHYLYVEQAMFSKQEKPYRVRIYKLSQKGAEFTSEIYTLKNEKEWIGKWQTPEVFDKLSENDIDLDYLKLFMHWTNGITHLYEVCMLIAMFAVIQRHVAGNTNLTIIL